MTRYILVAMAVLILASCDERKALETLARVEALVARVEATVESARVVYVQVRETLTRVETLAERLTEGHPCDGVRLPLEAAADPQAEHWHDVAVIESLTGGTGWAVARYGLGVAPHAQALLGYRGCLRSLHRGDYRAEMVTGPRGSWDACHGTLPECLALWGAVIVP